MCNQFQCKNRIVKLKTVEQIMGNGYHQHVCATIEILTLQLEILSQDKMNGNLRSMQPLHGKRLSLDILDILPKTGQCSHSITEFSKQHYEIKTLIIKVDLSNYANMIMLIDVAFVHLSKAVCPSKSQGCHQCYSGKSEWPFIFSKQPATKQ